MAQEFFATASGFLSITPNGAWTPGPVVGHAYGFATTGPEVKAQTLAILTNLNWAAVGCTFAPNVFVSGAGQIVGQATKCFYKSIALMKVNDTGNCTGTFNPPVGPPIPCSCVFKITVAGQNKVKGI